MYRLQYRNIIIIAYILILNKLTPIQAFLKKNEGFVHKILFDKREKMFQVNDLVRVADFGKTFSKRDTTNWSYNLF